MRKNMIFIKLIVFFLIIAALCFGLFYILEIRTLFYIAEGSIILSAVSFVIWLFKLFFMKDIDRSLKEIPNDNSENSVNWVCTNCGSINPPETKHCNNCGKEKLQ